MYMNLNMYKQMTDNKLLLLHGWLKSSLKYPIRFSGIFSKFSNRILLHIVLLKCQIAFLKIASCDNQALVGCIPIPAVAVHLNLKS